MRCGTKRTEGRTYANYVCVRQGFRSLHLDKGPSCPLTQTNRAPIGCRERFSPFNHERRPA